MEALPEHVSGAVERQPWTCDPGLGTSRKIVDPLSLTLSLQSESDQRVPLALEELQEHYPWQEVLIVEMSRPLTDSKAGS